MMDQGLRMMGDALKALGEENAKYDPLAGMPLAHTPRDFRGEELAIAELRRLSAEAKGFLAHHIKNTLASVNLYCEMGMTQKAKEAVWQLDDVVEQIVEEKNTSGKISREKGENNV